MKAYQYNSETKIYIGQIDCQIDPLQSEISGHEIWLLPADSTFEKPPKEKDGYNIKWNGDNWEYELIPLQQEPTEQTEEEKKNIVRSIRNLYLASTDFTQLVDSPFSEEEKEKYRQYRKYLRDYTDFPNWLEKEPLKFDEWIKNGTLENSDIGCN